MSPVKKVGDQNNLINTTNYPNYAVFPFEKFNPVQSRIFEFYNQDCNAVVASATSSGKTVCSEMMAAFEIRENKGKVIYLVPMKALAKEKYDEWTDENHHFSDLNISICTGDFRLTPERKKELEESNIVILSSEMLNSRCRNIKSEQNNWLKDVTLCITDESHLLTVPGRGDHLEVGLMGLSLINSECRHVFLSATMPNVLEIAEWLNTLNQKETYLLESKYRPCPLGIHYETYENTGYYEVQQENIVEKTIDIIKDYPDDKFLLFVHTKRTGEKLKSAMKSAGLSAEFHSADLTKEKRIELEKRFKDKNGLKYLIATSTLAWGCNTPARRVVILGMHRGLTEVDTYDIWQMAGRAGRPGYDPRGDVYILLPESNEQKHRDRLKIHQKIESRLLDNIGGNHKILAFHLVSEIHHGRIQTKDDVYKWYERTLARFQEKDLNNRIVNSTLELLLKCACIKIEDDVYKVTAVGMVASMYYYSPFDVADLRRNFFNIFKNGYENDDLYISLALANVDSLRMGIVSRVEKDEMGMFSSRVIREFGKDMYTEPVVKAAYCYNCLMNGINAGSLSTFSNNLQFDFPRLVEVLNSIDTIGTKWGKSNYFKEMASRVMYGVPSYLTPLVKIPEIGRVRAEKLWYAGIKDYKTIIDNPASVAKILNINDTKLNKVLNFCQEKNLMEELGINGDA